MADDLHNIPDHRGIASFGGNWASRRRREVAQNARHATRIGRRFQVPMSSVRQKSDLQAAQREANQSDLRFSISAENDQGGCRRWPRRASGGRFPEFGKFLLVAPFAEALLQSRAASFGIATCPMPTEPSRIQLLAKQWLSASRCLSN